MDNILPYKLYTSKEVADILDVHPVTIQRFVREGKLHAKKIKGGYRILGRSIEDFVGLENVDLAAVEFENALIAVDLGYSPNAGNLHSSDFYNITAGRVASIAKTAKNRKEMLDQITEFISETRRARKK